MAEHGPEQPVAGIQGWPRSLALEDGELLAESQDFQGSIGSGATESAHGGEEREKEWKHELTVVTRRKRYRLVCWMYTQPIDFTI